LMDVRENCDHLNFVDRGFNAQASYRNFKGRYGDGVCPFTSSSLLSEWAYLTDDVSLIWDRITHIELHRTDILSTQNSNHSYVCCLIPSQECIDILFAHAFDSWKVRKGNRHGIYPVQNRGYWCSCLFSPKKMQLLWRCRLPSPACGCT
jgi:hypothetical protein